MTEVISALFNTRRDELKLAIYYPDENVARYMPAHVWEDALAGSESTARCYQVLETTGGCYVTDSNGSVGFYDADEVDGRKSVILLDTIIGLRAAAED